MLQHEIDAAAGHDLEAGDASRGALGGDAEQLKRRFRRFDPGERGFDRAWPRHEAKHCGGDDAERAFRADEQVLQVVAGVVFLQLVEVVHHPAIGEHDFDAEHMRARDAVGDRRGAAGIGRKVAADGAGAFGRQELRIKPVHLRGSLAGALQGDACFTGNGVRRRIDFADAVEPIERQHDLVVQRDLAADEAGVAALRHDRRAGVIGKLGDCRYFRDGRWAQHHGRVALEHIALLDQIRRLHVRVGDGEFVADDRGKTREQGRVHLRFIEHRGTSAGTGSTRKWQRAECGASGVSAALLRA